MKRLAQALHKTAKDLLTMLAILVTVVLCGMVCLFLFFIGGKIYQFSGGIGVGIFVIIIIALIRLLDHY